MFCFAKSTTCGPMRKWSSISMASSWMEGKCSTPVGLPRAILGVPGLPNGKGPEGRGDTNVEIILTFQGKVPTLTARLLNFFFFLIQTSGTPHFILNLHASCGCTELLLYKSVTWNTNLWGFGKIFWPIQLWSHRTQMNFLRKGTQETPQIQNTPEAANYRIKEEKKF